MGKKKKRKSSRPEQDGRSVESITSQRRIGLFRILAMMLPVLALVLLEGIVRLAAPEPPGSQLRLQAQSYNEDFNPFVRSGDTWMIRPGWTERGETIRMGSSNRDQGEVVLLPTFRDVEMSVLPASGKARVFVFGGSTTFGLGVGAEEAFPAQLQRLLESQLGPGSAEVINLGCPGWASDRILHLARQSLDLGATMLVLYTGHNEMLERPKDIAGSGIGSKAALWLLDHSAGFGWVHHWMSRQGTETLDISGKELHQKIQSKVYEPQLEDRSQRKAISTQERESAAARYRSSLTALAEAAAARNVPVVFIRPVSNFFTPPKFSHDEENDRSDVWVTQLRDAWTDLRSGQIEQVRTRSQAVLEEAPGFAMAHFLLGLASGILQGPQQATPHLQAAVDLDHHTHRITSRLEGVLESVAQQYTIPLVDPRTALREPLSLDTATRHFIDHCHPTPLGHRLLAQQVAPTVSVLLAKRDRTRLGSIGRAEPPLGTSNP